MPSLPVSRRRALVLQHGFSPIASDVRSRAAAIIRERQPALANDLAGVIATGAQLALWWMAERPLLETLFRDARLTAAIVMGPASAQASLAGS